MVIQQNFNGSHPDGLSTLPDQNSLLDSCGLISIYIETYPGWLELPFAGTNYHGPKLVRTH